MDNNINEKENVKDQLSSKNIDNENVKIDNDLVDYSKEEINKQENKINIRHNMAFEICIDIASVIILIIGCGGGLLMAGDSIQLSLAAILLSLSITLILLAVKKLTIIEYGIYEEIKVINEQKDKL